MHTADSLRDALPVTKRYLLALGGRGWLKLGLVVLLIGGVGVANYLFNVPFQFGAEALQDPDALAVGLVVGTIGLAIYGAFRYLAAVLEFVFVESLRSERIHLRRYLRANLAQGVRLFAFRVALWIGLAAAVVAPIAAVFVVGEVSDPGALSTEQLVVFGLLAVGIFVGWRAIYTLTTAFVVPIMLHEERGPIDAWRRFAASMAPNWSGVIAYLLVAWLIGAVVWTFFLFLGFFVGFLGLFLWIILTAVAIEIHSSLAVVAIGVLLLGFLAYQYVLALLEAPVRSYVRYYALLLLGETDPALDLIPEQRAAVRGGDGPKADHHTASAGAATRPDADGWAESPSDGSGGSSAAGTNEPRDADAPNETNNESPDRLDDGFEGTFWDDASDRRDGGDAREDGRERGDGDRTPDSSEDGRTDDSQ